MSWCTLALVHLCLAGQVFLPDGSTLSAAADCRTFHQAGVQSCPATQTRVVDRVPKTGPSAARPDQRRTGEERIDLSLRDADLVEPLRSLARIGHVNLVLDPAVKGKVTVEFRDVPWEAALRVILRTHGLAAEMDGRILTVSDRIQR